PMPAVIPTLGQADRMVREHLRDPARCGGDWPVAGTPHEDPAAADNVYWRGRVWPPFNYLVYLGLVRYGFAGEATELAERSTVLFERGWSDRRSYENLNQRTGEGGDSPDSDHFYTLCEMLSLMLLLDEAYGGGGK